MTQFSETVQEERVSEETIQASLRESETAKEVSEKVQALHVAESTVTATTEEIANVTETVTEATKVAESLTETQVVESFEKQDVQSNAEVDFVKAEITQDESISEITSLEESRGVVLETAAKSVKPQLTEEQVQKTVQVQTQEIIEKLDTLEEIVTKSEKLMVTSEVTQAESIVANVEIKEVIEEPICIKKVVHDLTDETKSEKVTESLKESQAVEEEIGGATEKSEIPKVTPELVETFVEELVAFTETSESKIELSGDEVESFEQEVKAFVEEEVTPELVDTFVEELVEYTEVEAGKIEDKEAQQVNISDVQESSEMHVKLPEVIIYSEPSELCEKLSRQFKARPSISEEVAQVLIESQESLNEIEEPTKVVKFTDETEFVEHLKEKYQERPSVSDEVAKVLIDSQEIPEALILDKDLPDEDEQEIKTSPDNKESINIATENEQAAEVVEEKSANEEKVFESVEVSEVVEEVKAVQVELVVNEASENIVETIKDTKSVHIAETIAEKTEAVTETVAETPIIEKQEKVIEAFEAMLDEADDQLATQEPPKEERRVSELMKSEDIDELFVLMMPPGQSSFDVKDHDETEFDEKNAPRHADEPSEAGKEKLALPAVQMASVVKYFEEKYSEAKEEEKKVQDEMIAKLDESEVINTSIIKELAEEEQEESGFEITSKEIKSLDESTTGEQSLDLLQSDKTDSLFQSNTMNDSAQTLSEHTLEAELPSDYDTVADITVNATDDQTLQLEIAHVPEIEFEAIEKSPKEAEAKIEITETEIKVEITEEVKTQEVSEVKIEEQEISEIKVEALEAKSDDVEQVLEVKEEVIEKSEVSEAKSEAEVESKPTKMLKDSVHVTSLSPSKVATPKEKDEKVELIPNLSWDLKAKDQVVPPKEPTSVTLDIQGSLSQEQLGSTPSTEVSSEPRTGSSHDDQSVPSVPSSRMSERSGTQSSIELRTSSRSSHSTGPDIHLPTTSSSKSSGHHSAEEKMSGISETTSSSPYQVVSSSSPYTEETTEDSRPEVSSATSGSESQSKKQVTVTDSAMEYPPQEFDTKSPTAQLRSSGDISPQSLPSSPRHLRRTVSNGVKKITSEMFSTDNDLSRSLEIVYSEPSTDERRKLSERYRHTSSSSGASSGSVHNEQNKMEKRKVSVTQIRKTPDELATGESASSGQESEGVKSGEATTTTTSDGEMLLQHSSEPLESKTSPIKEKKYASPTKICTPAPPTAAVQEKICSEEFSPMLQVECKTPECKPIKG